ncbi:class I SAM-dependent methyltransferase, partial [Pseudomonas aeruginosa]|nr:class I SAM-dependent methyltransferase [Pseudomonas aeruginosa]
FSTGEVTHRRPLCNLSDWHLALALAAGQISGVVEGDDGTKLLIRGDTIKVKVQEVQLEEASNGDVRTTIVMRDKFVPTIVGIDFTPGARLGRLVNIR